MVRDPAHRPAGVESEHVVRGHRPDQVAGRGLAELSVELLAVMALGPDREGVDQSEPIPQPGGEFPVDEAVGPDRDRHHAEVPGLFQQPCHPDWVCHVLHGMPLVNVKPALHGKHFFVS